MALIPSFRTAVFSLVTLSSLAVLGICAHIEFLIAGYIDLYSSFAPLGLGVACLTVLTLPLFLALGNLDRRVFTSTILFEAVWFFVLWVLWAGTAGDTIAGRSYHFPGGCIYSNYPAANQICYEVTVVEAFAFLNCFAAFLYYDIVFLYAVISAIRGRGVWTVSVKEATAGAPGAVKSGVPVGQAQFGAPPPAPQYQNYGAYPANAPPVQPYSVYPQQVLPQCPPAQPYNPYAQQVPAQGFPPQQYGAYPHPAPPQDPSAIPPGQVQPYSYAPPPPPPPGAFQSQVNYASYSPSPTTNAAPLPPQPSYGSYPAQAAQPQHLSPTEYRGQPMVQEEHPFSSPYE